MQPRVIHFVPGLNSGGIGIVVKDWFIHKDSDVDFGIATISKGMIAEELIENNCAIYEILPLQNIGPIRYIKQCYKIIKAGKYNIVHSHVGVVSFLVFIAAMFAGVKVRIIHSHGTKFNSDTSSFLGHAAFSIFRFLSVLFANYYMSCTEAAAKYLLKNEDIIKQNTVIYNAIDMNRFYYSGKEKHNNVIIGCVGRFEPNKNQLFLLRVFSNIIKRGNTDYRLYFIGEGDKSRLIEFVEGNNLEHYVSFFEPISNIESFYHKIDVLAFPSLNEGFGLVALEAQACGTPCLISDGVPNDVIVSQLCVKKALDVDTWCDALINLAKSGKKDVSDSIMSKGFDIASVSRLLMTRYRGMVSEQYD